VRGVKSLAKSRARPRAQLDVLLVCSAGGHLLQLYMLRDAWRGLSVRWVTLDRQDSRSMLSRESVVFAHGPTTRNIPNLLRNLRLAGALIRRTRPRTILTTGAGLAVPFAWVGWLFGVEVVYVESFTRIESPSLSCRLIRPVASAVFVQWPELESKVHGSRYVGSVCELAA
jgi:UDP-N-acetylglucosamine:LPS N-acetylglucosamine transferase